MKKTLKQLIQEFKEDNTAYSITYFKDKVCKHHLNGAETELKEMIITNITECIDELDSTCPKRKGLSGKNIDEDVKNGGERISFEGMDSELSYWMALDRNDNLTSLNISKLNPPIGAGSYLYNSILVLALAVEILKDGKDTPSNKAPSKKWLYVGKYTGKVIYFKDDMLLFMDGNTASEYIIEGDIDVSVGYAEIQAGNSAIAVGKSISVIVGKTVIVNSNYNLYCKLANENSGIQAFLNNIYNIVEHNALSVFDNKSQYDIECEELTVKGAIDDLKEYLWLGDIYAKDKVYSVIVQPNNEIVNGKEPSIRIAAFDIGSHINNIQPDVEAILSQDRFNKLLNTSVNYQTDSRYGVLVSSDSSIDCIKDVNGLFRRLYQSKQMEVNEDEDEDTRDLKVRVMDAIDKLPKSIIRTGDTDLILEALKKIIKG